MPSWLSNIRKMWLIFRSSGSSGASVEFWARITVLVAMTARILAVFIILVVVRFILIGSIELLVFLCYSAFRINKFKFFVVFRRFSPFFILIMYFCSDSMLYFESELMSSVVRSESKRTIYTI